MPITSTRREDTNGNIIFLSNRDGYRNLYKYDPNSGEVTQLTDLITGVSGITHYAPAFSVDRRRNRLVYTYFSSQGYRIYQADEDDLLSTVVDPNDVDMTAATLPRVNSRAPRIVDPVLANATAGGEGIEEVPIEEVPYRPQFKLDYVGGGGGVGIGTSNTFGTTSGVAGGVDLLFSDILGNKPVFSRAST